MTDNDRNSGPFDDGEIHFIGPYRVDQQIGTGGMGAVYRAYDSRLERSVALKRIRTDTKSEKGFRSRLLMEAKAIAQLSHPNIVQIYDLMEHEGVDWIVMELVMGRDLRRLSLQRSASIDEILRYGLQIAKGLAAAHASNIVHRDLKAENVIVMADDRIKILDFGLARLSTLDMTRSSQEVLQGTPRSMAPEQALGLDIDHRADLFSFGVLLYECITGESPFIKGNDGVFQVLSRVCNQVQVPLKKTSGEVSQDLSDLVDHLLEKDPNDRPQSAEEVVLALQRLLDAPPPGTRVLFVDDEPDIEPLIRQWFRRDIRRGEMEVEFAQNGVAALEVLTKDPSIQMVFTDLNMPVMDGLSLLSEMGKLERPLVAVVISAYGDMANIRLAMNRGSFDFLTKPIDFADLEKTMAKAKEQTLKISDNLRLKAENELLSERNRGIREAFAGYLRGDAQMRDLVEPLVNQALESNRRFRMTLTLQMDRFNELPFRLGPQAFFQALHRFFHDAMARVRHHRATLLSVELGSGRMSLGFGAVIHRPIDNQRAMECAMDLKACVADLSEASRRQQGPAVACKIIIDASDSLTDVEMEGDSSTASQIMESWMERCSDNEIFVVDTRAPDLEELHSSRLKTI